MYAAHLAAHLAEVSKILGKGAVLTREAPGMSSVSVLDKNYADDNTKDGLQDTTDLVSHYSAFAGLHINVQKTKAMATGKSTFQRPYTEKDCLDVTVQESGSAG